VLPALQAAEAYAQASCLFCAASLQPLSSWTGRVVDMSLAEHLENIMHAVYGNLFGAALSTTLLV
jgi:hypothetical protein